MNNEFGKDFGLIHEMIITGRKAKMTQRAYAFLAHNEVFFSKLAGLIRHQAVLEKESIEATVADRELAEKLVKDVAKINEICGCIPCFFAGEGEISEKDKEAWELYLPYGFGADADADYWSSDEYTGIDWKEAVRTYENICKKLSVFPINDELNYLRLQRSQFYNRQRFAFRRMLTVHLRDIGLTPQELVEFSPAFKWKGEFEREDDNWISLNRGCYDYNECFFAIIPQLIEQRAILSLLK